MVGKKKEKQAAHELFMLPSTGSWSAQDVPVIQHGAQKGGLILKNANLLKKMPKTRSCLFLKLNAKKKIHSLGIGRKIKA